MEQKRVAGAVLAVGLLGLLLTAWWRVPWQPLPGPEPAPIDPTGVLGAARLAEVESFAATMRAASLGLTVLSVAVLVWAAVSPRLRRAAERLPGPWWVQVATMALGLQAAIWLVLLPVRIWLQHRVRAVGLSVQSWPGWLQDAAVSFLLGAVPTALGLVVLVGCARALPRWWPAVVAGLSAAAVMVGSFVWPVLVEPLFTEFEPLPDGSLRTRILELADQEGVPVREVLVADASRRTTALNAYVSGYGSTRRVVLYDSVVDDLDEPEAASIAAHELAHAAHDDVLTGSVLGAWGAIAGIGALALVLRRRPREAVAVPLLLALFAAGQFVASGPENAVSRRIETRADLDALRVTRDPEAFVGMQKELARRSWNDPTPPRWAAVWFGSHPTVGQRIARALRYPDG